MPIVAAIFIQKKLHKVNTNNVKSFYFIVHAWAPHVPLVAEQMRYAVIDIVKGPGDVQHTTSAKTNFSHLITEAAMRQNGPQRQQWQKRQQR